MTSGVARVGELDLAYDTRGAGEPLLLVAGFGMTRAMWSDELSDKLAGRGLQVVRMDNRDTGGSTRLTKLGVPDVPRLFLRSILGRTVTPLYTIEDMAHDAVGLMKSLGHGRFHVVGASMGGMIAQTIALEHPATLASMTSIMSTPGGRRYSFASLGALRGIMQRVPQDPKEQVEHFVRVFRVIAGDGLPFDEARARVTAEALAAAKPSTAGSARQFAAILDSSGRRRRRLPRNQDADPHHPRHPRPAAPRPRQPRDGATHRGLRAARRRGDGAPHSRNSLRPGGGRHPGEHAKAGHARGLMHA